MRSIEQQWHGTQKEQVGFAYIPTEERTGTPNFLSDNCSAPALDSLCMHSAACCLWQVPVGRKVRVRKREDIHLHLLSRRA